MKLVAPALLCLSFVAASSISVEQSPSSHNHVDLIDPQRRDLLELYEAKMPRAPAWQRARGDTVRTGPSRRSLHSRADAIARTQRVLAAHNAQHADGNASYYLAWNELSDLSDDEYRAFLRSRPSALPKDAMQRRHLLAGYTLKSYKNYQLKVPSINFGDATKTDTATVASKVSDVDTTPLPRQWNWLDIEGGKYLTPIKNQGTCGSCWAFSAVSVIESQYAIENKVQATPLSVEQVLSCSAPLDHIQSKFADMIASSKGCDGGMPFLAFEYMNRVAPNGIACASNYPYVMATQVDETQCRAVEAKDVAVAWKKDQSDYVAVEAKSEEALMRAIRAGPVSSNIDALGEGFRHYGGGIYDANDCVSDGKDVNHAVAVVGYGETAQGEKYWVVRNTWGTMWGENGYMRIARGKTAEQPYGPCNMYLFSTYPTKLAKGSSDQATCPIPTTTYAALGWTGLLALGGLQWALLLCFSLGCVIAGMTYFGVTEYLHARKAAAGGVTYEQNYERWVLPSREQIATMLARRRQRQAAV